jgi:hypothetical protein
LLVAPQVASLAADMIWIVKSHGKSRVLAASVALILTVIGVTACSATTSSAGSFPTACPSAVEASQALGAVTLEQATARPGEYDCTYGRVGVDVELSFAPSHAKTVAQFRSEERSYSKVTDFRLTDVKGIGAASYEFVGIHQDVDIISWVGTYQVDFSATGTTLVQDEAFMRMAARR